MDPPFSETSVIATSRKKQKRRVSPEQELPVQPSESCLGTSGVLNRRKRNRTNVDKESAPAVKRIKIVTEREAERLCEEESKQRKLRGSVRASRDAVLSTAVENNSSSNNVSRRMHHENTCPGVYSCRSCKHPLPERNCSVDFPAASPRSNEGSVSSSSSEIPQSPDYVGIIQQMETDENYARYLQAEYDREAEGSAPQPAEGRQLRSSVSDRPALTTQEASTSHSLGREVFRREVRASRRMRSALRRRAQSNRPPSLQAMLNAESFIEEIGLSLPFTDLLSVMHNEVDTIFSSLQGIHQNIENFSELIREGSANSDAGLNICGLSTAQIDRLPMHCYSDSHSSGCEENFQTSDCQICLSSYKEGVVLRTLPCFHEFHTSCIDKWLKINRSCPICRAVVAVGHDD